MIESDRNPDGPPARDAGYFGLDDKEGGAVIVPVPFEATVSYGRGTARGPEAVRRASHQVDLCDADVGDLRAVGVRTEPLPLSPLALSDSARRAAERVIEACQDGQDPDDGDLGQVEEAFAAVAGPLEDAVGRLLDAGRLPCVLGGDHSVALPGLLAAAQRHPGLGVLQFDAHADLRLAYEGFRFSHASVMRNLLDAERGARLVQVGIRDFSPEELALIKQRDDVTTFFDRQLRAWRLRGAWGDACRAIVDALPQTVWISFDIDGLDPTLCPRTGTPVPGGLSFDEAVAVLEAVATSGRRIVGIDLCEVSPGAHAGDDDSWDANVGARLLYKLLGFALRSRGQLEPPSLPGHVAPA